MYSAKDAHVVIRWCDMTTSDVAECLSVSTNKARTLRREPGRLLMGDIDRLAGYMGKSPLALVKELFWSDAPGIADRLNVG